MSDYRGSLEIPTVPNDEDGLIRISDVGIPGGLGIGSRMCLRFTDAEIYNTYIIVGWDLGVVILKLDDGGE